MRNESVLKLTMQKGQSFNEFCKWVNDKHVLRRLTKGLPMNAKNGKIFQKKKSPFRAFVYLLEVYLLFYTHFENDFVTFWRSIFPSFIALSNVLFISCSCAEISMDLKFNSINWKRKILSTNTNEVVFNKMSAMAKKEFAPGCIWVFTSTTLDTHFACKFYISNN